MSWSGSWATIRNATVAPIRAVTLPDDGLALVMIGARLTTITIRVVEFVKPRSSNTVRLTVKFPLWVKAWMMSRPDPAELSPKSQMNATIVESGSEELAALNARSIPMNVCVRDDTKAACGGAFTRT